MLKQQGFSFYSHIDYSKSCVTSFFCQSLTIAFFYSFLVFDAFLFFSLGDSKTDAFLTSLSLPTFFHEQYTEPMLVLHVFLTELSAVNPFAWISGWLHTCPRMLFFICFYCIAGLGPLFLRCGFTFLRIIFDFSGVQSQALFQKLCRN